MNTFFTESEDVDLFASTNTSASDSTRDIVMRDAEQQQRDMPSTDTSLSSSMTSRFFKMVINSSTGALRKDDNKENTALKQASTGVEKPSVAKKKKEKYKPTNLLGAIIKPEFSPPRAKKIVVQPLPQPAFMPMEPAALFSQEYEITCSGNFLMSDLKITDNGITHFPMSFSLSQSAPSFSMSPSKHSMEMTSLSSQSPKIEYVELVLVTTQCFRSRVIKRKRIDFDELIEERLLGTGASSSVSLVRNSTTGEVYARKSVTIGPDVQPKVILQEIKALYAHHSNSDIFRYKCKGNPYICGFHDAYFRDKKIHILLEYMDGNSLQDLSKIKGPIPEPILALVCLQMLRGLNFLHSNKRIIHRDMYGVHHKIVLFTFVSKPANVLVKKNGEVKISDFGLTGIRSSKDSLKFSLKNPLVFQTCQGTVMYMSPERIQEKDHTFVSDIWSFGVTIAELRMGKFPLKSPNSYFDILDEVTNMTKMHLPDTIFSPELADFLWKCTEKDPSVRWQAAQLLNHPFIVQYTANQDEKVMKHHLSQWML